MSCTFGSSLFGVGREGLFIYNSMTSPGEGGILKYYDW